MPFVTPSSEAMVEEAVAQYGAAPGGKAMMQAEAAAAKEAMASGCYVTWRSAAGADCARVGSKSRCMCGHTCGEHEPLNRSDPRAPACLKCACRRFEYVPSRPEECGMWWLPRRKGFNVHTWRAPCVCKHGHDMHDPVHRRCKVCGCGGFRSDFACIGCDGRAEAHETVFETEEERRQAGRPVGEAFVPLAENPALQAAVLRPQRSAAAQGGASGAQRSGSGPSPEALLECGEIDAAEYHRRVAALPPPAAGPSAEAGGPGGELVPAAGGRGQPREQGGSWAPTVRSMNVRLGDGRTAQLMTNIGPPQPVPGRDWSRPYEPARHAARGGAPKLGAGRGRGGAPSGRGRGAPKP